jgi:hypothetical protein
MITWFTFVRRSVASRRILCLSASGMRSTTTPLAPGATLRRPEGVTGTAKRSPRIPTATSFMFPRRTLTSSASRLFNWLGMRTITLLRVLSAKLIAV